MNALTVKDWYWHFPQITEVYCIPLNNSSMIETYDSKYSEQSSNNGFWVSAAPLNLADLGVSSSWSYSKI